MWPCLPRVLSKRARSALVTLSYSEHERKFDYHVHLRCMSRETRKEHTERTSRPIVHGEEEQQYKHFSIHEVERESWHVLHSYNLFSSAPHLAFFLLCEQEHVLRSSSRCEDDAINKHSANHTLLKCICDYCFNHHHSHCTAETDQTIPNRRYQRYALDTSKGIRNYNCNGSNSRRSDNFEKSNNSLISSRCSHSGTETWQDTNYDIIMQSNLSSKVIPLLLTMLLHCNQQCRCHCLNNWEESLPISTFTSEENVVKWLCIAVRDDEVSKEQVQQLMHYLMHYTYHSDNYDHNNNDSSQCDRFTHKSCNEEKYNEQFNKHVCSILEWATALHVLDVIECLQYECKSDSTVSNMYNTTNIYGSNSNAYVHHYGIHREWHPMLHPETIKICLRHLMSAVVVRRACSVRACGNITPDPSLHSFHSCILCAFPPELTPISLYHDIAVLSVMTLKHASCTELCNWFAYARQFTSFTPVFSNKFLACCAMNVNELGQRGLEVSVRDRVIINHAFHELCTSSCKAHEIEEGLVHGCAILNSLRCFQEVRHLYTSHEHQLRETAHSVLACVALHDAHAACLALDALALSKSNGWRVLNPMTWQVMMAVCRLVGSRGNVSQIHDVYNSLVHFHNHVLKLSNLMETVLGGLCDRVERFASMYRNLTDTHATNIITSPREKIVESVTKQKIPFAKEVVHEVNSILWAILMYIGDDFNADTVFKFIECTVRVPHIAVQLTTSVVWLLSRSSSLAIRDLFRDVSVSDHKISFHSSPSSPSESSCHRSKQPSALANCKSINQPMESFSKENKKRVLAWVGLPLIKYYAVCIAREMNNQITLDHLCSVWQIHANDTLEMPWRPSYQLWQCAECGRANSDRFNYCVCSALQATYAMCNRCGHAHDERVEICLHCGADLRDRSKIYSFTIRQSWVCYACNKSNPARLMWQCVYCHAWTGPLAKARHAFDEARKTNSSNLQRRVTCGCTCNDNVEHDNNHPYGSSQCKQDVHNEKSTQEYHKQFNTCFSDRSSNNNYKDNGNGNGDTIKNACMYYLGYCPSCGQFEWTFSYLHSFVWQCSSCHKLRCSLERYCPECPEVVCAPALYRHECTTRRYCSACHAVVTNPFTLICPFCHGCDYSRENVLMSSGNNIELRSIHFGNTNNNENWQSYSTLRYEPCEEKEERRSYQDNVKVQTERTMKVVTNISPSLPKERNHYYEQQQQTERHQQESATHAVTLFHQQEEKKTQQNRKEELTVLHINKNVNQATSTSCEQSYICECCFVIYTTTMNDCTTCKTKNWHLLTNMTRTCQHCQHVIASTHYSLICPLCHCHVPLLSSQEKKTSDIPENNKTNTINEERKKDVSKQNESSITEIISQESNSVFTWDALASCVCTCKDISTLFFRKGEKEHEHYSNTNKLNRTHANQVEKSVDIINTIQTLENLIANEGNLCCVIEKACASALSITLIDTMRSIEEQLYGKHEWKKCTWNVRRALALTKQLLSNWYTTLSSINYTVENYSFFHSHERCHACLGSHTFELCSFYAIPWMCEMCGVMNVNRSYSSDTVRVLNISNPIQYKNSGNQCEPNYNINSLNKNCKGCSTSSSSSKILASRYVCINCLSLRPCVQLLMPAECWLCTWCHRANVEFEMYCIYCGAMHETANGTQKIESSKNKKGYDICNNENKYTRTIPFAPMKCTKCHTLYLEASCPECDEHDDTSSEHHHHHHHHQINNMDNEEISTSKEIIHNTVTVGCPSSHSSSQVSPGACELCSSTGAVITHNTCNKTTYTPRNKNENYTDKENNQSNVVSPGSEHATHLTLRANMRNTLESYKERTL